MPEINIDKRICITMTEEEKSSIANSYKTLNEIKDEMWLSDTYDTETYDCICEICDSMKRLSELQNIGIE